MPQRNNLSTIILIWNIIIIYLIELYDGTGAVGGFGQIKRTEKVGGN
jgi:hypothetical protein